MPGIESLLVKYVFADDSVMDVMDALTGTWDVRYTEDVLRRE